MNKILKIVFNVIFVLMIVLLSLYFSLRLLGMAEIYKVQTGSMEDGIHAGDYILIYKKDKYNVGDVVTYKKEGYHVTHRIIKKNGNKVITKGDANNIEDEEISVKSIVGEVVYNGGILNFLIDYKYALASALLALYLLSCYFGRKKEKNDFEEEIDDERNYEIEKVNVDETEKIDLTLEKDKNDDLTEEEISGVDKNKEIELDEKDEKQEESIQEKNNSVKTKNTKPKKKTQSKKSK